jgi:hypothetical protein
VTGPSPMGPELVFHDPLSDSLAEQHAGSPDVPGCLFVVHGGNSISIRRGKTSVVDTGLRRATFHPEVFLSGRRQSAGGAGSSNWARWSAGLESSSWRTCIAHEKPSARTGTTSPVLRSAGAKAFSATFMLKS